MKTKYLLASFLGLLVAGSASAAWLDASQVRKAAEAFSTTDVVGFSVLSGCTLKNIVPRDALWVAQYKPSGHAVFSGSDLVGPVIVFSDKDYIEPEEGEAFYDVLKGASDGCRAVESAPETADGLRRRAKWQKLLSSAVTLLDPRLFGIAYDSKDPFLATRWNQCQPRLTSSGGSFSFSQTEGG